MFHALVAISYPDGSAARGSASHTSCMNTHNYCERVCVEGISDTQSTAVEEINTSVLSLPAPNYYTGRPNKRASKMPAVHDSMPSSTQVVKLVLARLLRATCCRVFEGTRISLLVFLVTTNQ